MVPVRRVLPVLASTVLVLGLAACKATATADCPGNVAQSGGTCPVAVPSQVPASSSPGPSTTPTPTLPPPTSNTTAAPATAKTNTTPPATGSAPSTSGASPQGGCAQPDVYHEGDGVNYGPGDIYFVHNNAWNWGGPGSGQHETLYACDYNNWWVDAGGMSGTDVKTYPNVHLDINGGDKGAPLSNYTTISSRFANTTPTAGGWDAAYDVWLNGLATDSSTEVMVWTAYHQQTPAGDVIGTYTATGVTFDVWTDHDGYVAYVARTALYSGSVDLMAIFKDGIAKKIIPAGPVINQIDYGIEYCSTAGATQRFTVTDFALAMR